jgi:hypothetical protein
VVTLRSSLLRAACVAAVVTVGGAAARADRVDDLSRAVTSDPSWRVRLQAVVVIGKLGDRRAMPALMHALNDPNETVRGLAARVLGDLGDARSLAALERAKSDTSAFVREKAAESLRRLAPQPKEEEPGALHVEVGGVGAKARQARPELTHKLKELIIRELSRTPGLTLEGKPLSGFLIDSAITNLNRHVSNDWVEISCEVSFIVGRLPSKAMVMMTSGGATVQAPKVGFKLSEESKLQEDALEGAVKGAHENLLAFLKTQQVAGRAASR